MRHETRAVNRPRQADGSHTSPRPSVTQNPGGREDGDHVTSPGQQVSDTPSDTPTLPDRVAPSIGIRGPTPDTPVAPTSPPGPNRQPPPAAPAEPGAPPSP